MALLTAPTCGSALPSFGASEVALVALTPVGTIQVNAELAAHVRLQTLVYICANNKREQRRGYPSEWKAINVIQNTSHTASNEGTIQAASYN